MRNQIMNKTLIMAQTKKKPKTEEVEEKVEEKTDEEIAEELKSKPWLKVNKIIRKNEKQ